MAAGYSIESNCYSYLLWNIYCFTPWLWLCLAAQHSMGKTKSSLIHHHLLPNGGTRLSVGFIRDLLAVLTLIMSSRLIYYVYHPYNIITIKLVQDT